MGLNKEKKHLSATQAKSSEDLVAAEEKVAHLMSIKSQLQSTLDQLDSGLDKEKKSRAALEKQKRKVEGDLRKAVLCWKLQIARDVQPNKNLLTPMRHLQTLEMST